MIALGSLAALAMLMQAGESGGATTVRVISASLSLDAKEGRAYFKLNCQTCHGENAAGTDQGPPLIHDIYNPGHHSDESFFLAAAIGVRQHHWPYGDMPAQPQVSREQVALIIRYIRELQEANGITYKRHGG
jgi:mono/diheme cytochrome c family protein